MDEHTIVGSAEWLAARRELLQKEKEFTHARDAISAARRVLPWERVEKDYAFETPRGRASLADLFDGRQQLVIYHFMLGPEWEEGCKSCSFWVDNFNGVDVHLGHRDVTLIAVSQAPLAKIEAYRRRMGWTIAWVSSFGSDFNFDYQVSFRPEDVAAGTATYNYAPTKTTMSELPGISVFFRDDAGAVFHTYSCYARGLDMLNGAYHYLDLVPKGRDETGLPQTMSWLRRHDQYED
ncbi:MAG: thioredoxin family protein [Casimicrobiaceae bacterium]